MTKREPMACRTCKHVLDEDLSGRPVHSRDIIRHGYDESAWDHIPDPAPMSQVKGVQFECDFCTQLADLDSASTLPAKSFSLLPMGNFRGNWMTCAACAPYVRAKAWSRLIDSRRDEAADATLKTLLLMLYRVLEKNITGELRPASIEDAYFEED